MSRDWKPVVITTKPGEEPVPQGVIDVTPETIGDRKAVADINAFRARLEAKRANPTPTWRDDDPPPRAA